MRSSVLYDTRLGLRFLSAVCAALSTVMPSPAQSNRHGGIEIGSKGVKAIVLEIAPEASDKPVKVLFTKTANTTLADLKDGSFRRDALEETVAAVDALFREITAPDKYNVAEGSVRVVASSGLPNAPNKADLARMIKDKTGRDLAFINVQNEVLLSILGLAIRGDKDQALLIDIGSGNTKGGYLNDRESGKVAYISVPLGTVTYAARVEKEVAKGDPWPKRVAALRDEALNKPLRAQVSQNPDLGKKTPVYLLGGVVWAMATMLHPEHVDRALVPLTVADIDAFRQLLAKDPTAFPAVDETSFGETAQTELRRVRDTFTPENLIAGAEVLAAIADTFGLAGKQLYFARNGQAAWLLGYVVRDSMPQPPKTKVIQTQPVAPTTAVPAPAPQYVASPYTNPNDLPRDPMDRPRVIRYIWTYGMPGPIVYSPPIAYYPTNVGYPYPAYSVWTSPAWTHWSNAAHAYPQGWYASYYGGGSPMPAVASPVRYR